MADLGDYVDAVMGQRIIGETLHAGHDAINAAVESGSAEQIITAALLYHTEVVQMQHPERVPPLARAVLIAMHARNAKLFSQSQPLSPLELFTWLSHYNAGPNFPATKAYQQATTGDEELRQTPIIRVVNDILFDEDVPDFSDLPEELNRYHTALVALGRPKFEIAMWLVRLLVNIEAGRCVRPDGIEDLDISSDLDTGI